MTHSISIEQQNLHEVPHGAYEKTLFGFWIYLMTDCVLFATLFATYAVLHNNTFGGPSSHDLFDLPFALLETLILLTSSFICGLAILEANRKNKMRTMIFLVLTFFLGASFLALELKEFKEFVEAGNSWQRSAFLSSFFTLVGTHGLHITCGLIWVLVMMGHVIFRGFTSSTLRRLACFSLYWHFLDVVWVLIFAIVYLMGVA